MLSAEIKTYFYKMHAESRFKIVSKEKLTTLILLLYNINVNSSHLNVIASIEILNLRN